MPSLQSQRQDERLRRHLARLQVARGVLCLALLAAVHALGSAGGELSGLSDRLLRAALSFSLASSALGAAWLVLRRPPRVLAAVQLVTDVGVVSTLLSGSGGSESVFTPLYVLVIVYGAILFGRSGAYVASGLAALGFGAVLFAAPGGGLGPAESATPLSMSVMRWAVHAGALLLVALLASVLARELRRTGQALDESRSDLGRLRRLHERTVESLLSGLLTTDNDERITSFNPEAERITGLREAEALGASLCEVLRGAESLLRLPPGVDPGQARVRMAHRNRRGEELHLGLAASILREADGSPAGHVLIFQDVTQVTAMEAQLRRSERLAAVGQLSAAIAHEVRNPLAAISGSIQMLQGGPRDGAADEERARLMDIVLRETDRLNGLITDFLQYARPAAGRPEAVELAGVVEEVLKMFDAARPAQLRVEMRIPPRLCVEADPAQLRQVLWNLCLNAAQAMPKGGLLTVSAALLAGGPPAEPRWRKPGQDGAAQAPAAPRPRSQASSGRGRNTGEDVEGAGWVEIVVADQGVGIPADALERIFDPFFTTKRGGSGLGLATVHRIVEAHGGWLGVESRVGVGTSFRVALPRAQENT